MNPMRRVLSLGSDLTPPVVRAVKGSITFLSPTSLLGLAAFVVPLWFLPISYESFLLPKTALLATFSALAAASLFLRDFGFGGRAVISDRRSWGWIGLLAVFCLAYALSPWRAAETGAFLHDLSWALAGLTASLIVLPPDDGQRLAVLAATAGVASAAWSLWQGAGTTSTFGNPEFLASYLAACGPLLVWLSAASKSRYRPAWAASLAVVAAALLATGTRGAWFAAGLAWTCAFAAAVRSSRDARVRHRLKTAAGWVALGALCAATLYGSFILRRAASTFRVQDAAPQERFLMWRAAWDMLRDRPLLGQGPGGYHYRHLEHQARLLAGPGGAEKLPYWVHTHSAHNIFLHLAAETGALGGAVFLLLLWTSAWAWARYRKISPTEDPSLRDAWACSALALLLDGLFGQTLQLPASALLFALALAASSTPPTARSNPPPANPTGRPDIFRIAPAAIISLVLLLLPARLWLRQAAEISIARAMAAAARADWPAAEKELRHATTLAPSSGQAQFFLGNALLLSGQPDLAAEKLNKAAGLVSDPNIPYDLGLANLERGDYAGTERWMRVALRLKPAFPEAFATLGDVARKLGRLAEAETHFKQALAIAPENRAILRELGLLYAQMGRRRQALELLGPIASAYPDDAEALTAVRRLNGSSHDLPFRHDRPVGGPTR